jgi:endo-1,4-beta-xylanase
VYPSTPAWVTAINNPIELERVMLEHISAFTKRYGDAINQWTVVNEPLSYVGDTSAIHPNHFSTVLGPNWIADAFRIARRGAPHASLWLNEVFTEDDPAKAHALVTLATNLVAEHVPINGVSLEGHLFTPSLMPMSPDFTLVHQTLEQLSALGLHVSLSEIDDPTFPTTPHRFQVQSSNINRLVAACLGVPRCGSINFWDIDDSKSWLDTLFNNPNVDPTLFTAQQQPKRAFTALVNTLLTNTHS